MSTEPAKPMPTLSLDSLRFDTNGLIVAVVQDAGGGEVLMVAYMNRESLEQTLRTGETWFYSRSRQALWHKGESSGNQQKVRWLRADCDGDALLVGVEQAGYGACHVEGQRSCFWNGLADTPSQDARDWAVMPQLARVIAARHAEMPENSYTTKLFRKGVDRIAQKVGEEAIEVVIAAKNHALQPGSALAGEVADLLYHLIVLAEAVGLDAGAVFAELSRRRASRDGQ